LPAGSPGFLNCSLQGAGTGGAGGNSRCIILIEELVSAAS